MTRFASRAGEKLQFALDTFNIDVTGLTCADFGSSTGGFVDCLLAAGVTKVYSVDTAYGELAWKLRNDKRVVVIERTNAMHVVLPPPLHEATDGHSEKVDLVTIDVGWTKQEKILPNALINLKPDGKIITLIKPHYEAPDSVRRGRLDEDQLGGVLESVVNKIEGLGMKVIQKVESPIRGGKAGNKEFLFLIAKL